MRVGQQTGGKAVLGIVGFGNRRVEIAVANDLQQRAEELFVRALGYSGYIDDTRGQQGSRGLRLGHAQQRHATVAQQLCLGIKQRLGCRQRDDRAHERCRLLIEGADGDGLAHLDQTLEQ
ncbi:hypothetical protein D3C80_1618260 [compost metagenome]